MVGATMVMLWTRERTLFFLYIELQSSGLQAHHHEQLMSIHFNAISPASTTGLYFMQHFVDHSVNG